MKKIAFIMCFLMILASVAPVVSHAAANNQIEIKANGVRLRADSNTNSKIIDSVDKGATFIYLATTKKDSEGYPWFKIALEDKSTAYVRSDLAKLVPASTKQTATKAKVEKSGNQPKGVIKVTSKDGLNLRKSADSYSEIIGVVPYGKEVNFYELKNGWYLVVSDGKPGYIYSYYTSVLSEVAGPEAPTEKALGEIQVLSNDGLNIRSNPSITGDIVGVIPEGQKASYFGIENGWYEIEYDGKMGFIHSKLTKLIGAKEAIDKFQGYVRINAMDGLNVRASASTSSDSVNVIPYGAVVKFTDQNATWYRINYQGQSGWIFKQYASVTNPEMPAAGIPVSNRQEAWMQWAEGKFLDPNGDGVSWCTDTVNQYALDLFGKYRGISNGGNARDLMKNASDKYFVKIYFNADDPSTYPRRGDILVWGGSYSNPAGHTGICVEDSNSVSESLRVLHSAHNFSPYDAAAVTTRSYSYSSGNLVGVLRVIPSMIKATHAFGTK
ncbi:SH3 domain-containing protein [Guggenheimella bovis]